jgi:phage terminase Nu1 subunit (DNA packaging protein)
VDFIQDTVYLEDDARWRRMQRHTYKLSQSLASLLKTAPGEMRRQIPDLIRGRVDEMYTEKITSRLRKTYSRKHGGKDARMHLLFFMVFKT